MNLPPRRGKQRRCGLDALIQSMTIAPPPVIFRCPRHGSASEARRLPKLRPRILPAAGVIDAVQVRHLGGGHPR